MIPGRKMKMLETTKIIRKRKYVVKYKAIIAMSSEV